MSMRWPEHAARFFEEPVAAEAPEITALIWTIKTLTTAGGSTLDFLSLNNKVVGEAIAIAVFQVALSLQYGHGLLLQLPPLDR
jgi:uncharacterized membrane-anchored protein